MAAGTCCAMLIFAVSILPAAVGSGPLTASQIHLYKVGFAISDAVSIVLPLCQQICAETKNKI